MRIFKGVGKGVEIETFIIAWIIFILFILLGVS